MLNRKNLVTLTALRIYLDTWPVPMGCELSPDQREDRVLAHKLIEEIELAEFQKTFPCKCMSCY